MKIIGVGGQPGTGKSQIMKSVLEQIGKGYEFKYKLLRGYKYLDFNPRLLILGIYEEGVLFCGTDRLSMVAIKSLKEFVKYCVDENVFLDYTILFEGDRFFKQEMFRYLESYNIDYSLYVLEVEEEILTKRREDRGLSNQTEKFLKGRKTMYENIKTILPHKTTILTNNTLDESQKNIKTILDSLGIEQLN